MGKFKNGKAIFKYKVAGDMIKSGVDMVVDWIWRFCNMHLKIE